MKKLVLILVAAALLAVARVGVAYAPEASVPRALPGQELLEISAEIHSAVDSSDRKALEELKEKWQAVNTTDFSLSQTKLWEELGWQIEMLGLKSLEHDLAVAEQAPVRLMANFWLLPVKEAPGLFRPSERVQFEFAMAVMGIEDVGRTLGLKEKLLGSPWRERASLFVALLGDEGFERDQALVSLWGLCSQEGFEGVDQALTDFARTLYGQSVAGSPPLETLEEYVQEHLKRCLRAHPDLCPLDGEWEIFRRVVTPEDLPPPSPKG